MTIEKKFYDQSPQKSVEVGKVGGGGGGGGWGVKGGGVYFIALL